MFITEDGRVAISHIEAWSTQLESNTQYPASRQGVIVHSARSARIARMCRSSIDIGQMDYG
jgi:hypothetical protein